MRGGDPFDRNDVIHQDALDRLAATLDVTRPERVPPLWHWVSFLETSPSSSLGIDGHPRTGGLIPEPPHPRRMFVGGRMRIDAPFPIGIPVRRTASVGEVVHKMGRSGPLAFVTVRFAYSVHGRVFALEEQDLVYRPDASLGSAASARAQGSGSSTGPVPEDEPALKGEVTFNEPMLFRFSALTFNSHRIHYDLPYARDVEHHPGLVVQGPLLIVRLLELVREAHGDAAVRELSFRAVEPCFCGSTVTLSGRSKGDDGLHLVASRDEVALMTADVALRRGST